MNLQVLNKDGQPTGRTVELPAEIFGVEPNDHVVYLAVKQYLANQRQGTHKAKERNEIAGSTRKLHKQKGTGGSRKGDIKNPVFRGGGRIFGPRPRSYSFKLNKKVKQLARYSVLSQKAMANNIMVVEDFNFDMPKTKSYLSFLSNLGIHNSKSLLVVSEPDNNLVLSSRNIQNARVSRAQDINVYSILHANKLVFSESGLRKLVEGNWGQEESDQ
jgi:large subunit ribosomal protein L4